MNAIRLLKGNADPVDDLLACQEAIRAANWWPAAGVKETWPLTTEDAAQLLQVAGQYAIDADQLQDLVDRGLMARPAGGEDLEWSAVDVLQAATLLETRQQWRPFPSVHDPKKDHCQLLLEQARAENEVHLIMEIDNNPRWDLRHLLIMLAASDNREGRAKILAMVKAHLEVTYEVFLQ